MWNVVYTKGKGWVPVGAIFVVLSTACDRTPQPVSTVGGVGISEAVIASLSDLERQALADIVGLGLAVARDETDSLGAPVVARAAAESRAVALPYWLAAQTQGWSEEDLRTAYSQQPEVELVVRHMVRMAQGNVPPTVRDSARRVAERVAERALAGEDFATLAAEFSEEPGAAERGGLLQPGRQGGWVEPFWAAAEALAPGQASGVVQTMYGYHVLKLEERRAVPFDEASRTALLLRTVPAAFATRAAEEWAAGPGSISVEPAATSTALTHLLAGEPVPDNLVLARGAEKEYRGDDLAAGWALLDPTSRAAVEGGGADALTAWLADDARIVLWAAAASDAGLDVPDAAMAEAEARWRLEVATWTQAFGFAPSASLEDGILDLARQALLSGTPEARSARSELRSLRPRLRELYPVIATP